MNHNHFNPELTYSLKAKRVHALLHDLREAEAIIKELPEDAVQSIWSKVAAHKLPPKSAKGKAASKGVYKRSLKKTLEALIVPLPKFRPSSNSFTRIRSNDCRRSTGRVWKPNAGA